MQVKWQFGVYRDAGQGARRLAMVHAKISKGIHARISPF